jgi:hypothetical protein
MVVDVPVDRSLVVGMAVFLFVFGGALGGMLVRRMLPDHHRTKETEDVIKLGMGVVATMSALVIGLLIASAKSAFDTKDAEVKQLAGNMILLDRQLAQYGPEGKEARDLLREYAVYKMASTWPEESHGPIKADGWTLLEDVQRRLRALTPASDGQRWLQTRALEIAGELAQTRWLLYAQMVSPVPTAFLVVLVLWLTLIFASFGLFAPSNGTALIALGLSSLSIAGAIFLILEMAVPFSGLIQIPSTPMHEALSLLGH